jgi:hypothetical protein
MQTFSKQRLERQKDQQWAGDCLAGGQPPHGDQGLSARLSTPPPPSFHGYHGNSGVPQLWCVAIRGFMVTMATPTHGN